MAAVVCSSNTLVDAQTASDAVMMKPGEICLDVNYTNNSWDHYWEGDSLRDNGNIGTLTTHNISGMFMLGIINRVNLLAALPYVITSPSGGVVAGDKGFQDAAFMVKVDAFDKKIGPGTLKLLASAGVMIPSSNYICENPFAIGLGCADGVGRGIVHYDFDMGLYVRADMAYHLRGESYLQREYYYTTGGYYTNEVDMPNAYDFNITAGYITPNKHIKVEGVLSNFNTLGGFDIRRQDGGFPSNDMELMNVGLNADYYDLAIKGLAVHFKSGYTLTGRNVGQSMMFSGGVSYQFPIWTPKSSSTTSTAN